MEPGELRVWKEAYGAPSFDHMSLRVLTYAKINSMWQLKIVKACMPFWRDIPSYRNSTGVFVKPRDMIAAMRVAFGETDTDATSYAHMSQRIAVMNRYIGNTLTHAYAITFYHDTDNYTNITKPYYYGIIPFPFKYAYVRFMACHYRKRANVERGRQDLDKFLVEQMREAEKCIVCIAGTLGENPYIVGEQPCSLDALIYGLLAPIYYAPLKQSALQDKIKSYYNLCKYIERITDTYFPEVNGEPVAQEEDNERAPTWQIALAGLSAVTVMCWFAYSKGLIRVVF